MPLLSEPFGDPMSLPFSLWKPSLPSVIFTLFLVTAQEANFIVTTLATTDDLCSAFLIGPHTKPAAVVPMHEKARAHHDHPILEPLCLRHPIVTVKPPMCHEPISLLKLQLFLHHHVFYDS